MKGITVKIYRRDKGKTWPQVKEKEGKRRLFEVEVPSKKSNVRKGQNPDPSI